MISKNQLKELDKNGYVFIKNFKPEFTTSGLAETLGETERIPNYPILHCLTPRKKANSPKHNYSGNFGLNDFPIHTDLAHWHIPPRFILLRCIKPAPKVFSYLLSFGNALCGVFENTISRAHFYPRKKILGKRFLLPFRQNIKNGKIYRWDSLFLTPANKEANEVCVHFTKFLHDFPIKKIEFTNFFDTIIINNWKILHGRSSVSPRNCNRVIERVYLGNIYR